MDLLRSEETTSANFSKKTTLYMNLLAVSMHKDEATPIPNKITSHGAVLGGSTAWEV